MLLNHTFQTTSYKPLKIKIQTVFKKIKTYIPFYIGSSLLMLTSFNNVHADTLLIKNARILNAEQTQVSKITNQKTNTTQDILIQNGKIVQIRKSLKVTMSQNEAFKVVDAKGSFLIPGLIDSHVHLDGVPGYNGNDPEDADMLKESRLQIPRSYLYFGFTTVLDLIGDPAFIQQWNAQPISPQAYFCSAVTIPNGYPAAYFDKTAQFTAPGSQYMLLDPQQANVYPIGFNKDAHSPQAVTLKAKEDGASCIKIFYESGFGPKKNLALPSVELISEVVKQAHLLKLPVYLHGNSQDSHEFAIKTGVDTLVHGLWHEKRNVDPTENQKTLDQIAAGIAKSRIAVQPTIQVLYGEQEIANPHFFDNPQVSHAIPKHLQKWYQSEQGQWMKNIILEEVAKPKDSPKVQYQNMRLAYQHPLNHVRDMVKRLSQHGSILMFGSDTPSGPFYTQFPGVNGRWEMDRWLESGLSLQQLFSAMTIENARRLGLENELGSVEIGKTANLLLLKKNPLATIKAYDSIEYVIVKGQLVKRNNLSAH